MHLELVASGDYEASTKGSLSIFFVTGRLTCSHHSNCLEVYKYPPLLKSSFLHICINKEIKPSICLTLATMAHIISPCTFCYYLVRNKRTGYDLKKPNDFVGGSGGYAP